MYETICLTEHGERIAKAFMKVGMPYPEARFLCFLRMLHVDLLVNVYDSDVGGLAEIVNQQVRDREILFPYTYGRLLYDKNLSTSVSENREGFTAAETREFLAGTPQGVFQVGNFVTGPFGLLKSGSRRSILPSSDVRFHCSDMTCDIMHTRKLVTDRDAQINKNREAARKVLEKDSKEISDWTGYFERFDVTVGRPYDDLSGDPVVYLLGDALTLQELQAVLAFLLDNTQGQLRQIASQLGITGGQAARMVGPLNEAELLQLALMTSNEHIFAALDTLVAEQDIRVPLGEIRRPMTNRGRGWGPFRLQPELGRFGIRLRSSEQALGPLRLRRLVTQMYELTDPDDREELRWQLRDEEAPSLEGQVEQYLQMRTARESVTSLLLARRRNFDVAARNLSLGVDIFKNDSDRVNAVMWKLGFSVEDILDPHAGFWSIHDRMTQVTRQSPINPGAVDAEQVRRHANSYFVKLEDLLRDSLLYTTWALTNDHIASTRPFLYRPTVDETKALGTLRSFSSAEEAGAEHQLVLDEKLTIYQLSRGFQILADLLSSFCGESDKYLRPPMDLPSWRSRQSLQDFVFLHTVPFLDLLDESRASIIQQLREISRRLVGAEVNEARNEWFHARRSPLDINRLRLSLEAVRDAVSWIEDGGYSRHTYRRVRIETDEANRRTFVLADSRGQEVVFFRPSRFTWMSLPALEVPQHVMLSARFADPTETLRFVSEVDSPYSEMWRDFPVRMAKSASLLTTRHHPVSAS
ncbi:hypothetical protein [Micromonospora sp. NPDC004551]|uniref:hypothetical protein n=1 Tax=Micromonospora sp. NPDC004551 TaxID=3154284 RepID=UPI0033B37BE5